MRAKSGGTGDAGVSRGEPSARTRAAAGDFMDGDVGGERAGRSDSGHYRQHLAGTFAGIHDSELSRRIFAAVVDSSGGVHPDEGVGGISSGMGFVDAPALGAAGDVGAGIPGSVPCSVWHCAGDLLTMGVVAVGIGTRVRGDGAAAGGLEKVAE